MRIQNLSRWIYPFLLAGVLLSLSACGQTNPSSQTPSESSQGESLSSSQDQSSEAESSQPVEEPVSAPEAQPSSSLPDANSPVDAPDAQEIDEETKAADLQKYLIETLPPESYSYLNIGEQAGAIHIGYLDETTVKEAVASYTGPLCQVVYQPAQCSVAQKLTLLEAVKQSGLISQEVWVEPASQVPGAFEELHIYIHAPNEEKATQMEKEIGSIAEEQGFPVEYLEYTHMTLGENPNT